MHPVQGYWTQLRHAAKKLTQEFPVSQLSRNRSHTFTWILLLQEWKFQLTQTVKIVRHMAST